MDFFRRHFRRIYNYRRFIIETYREDGMKLKIIDPSNIIAEKVSASPCKSCETFYFNLQTLWSLFLNYTEKLHKSSVTIH